PARRVGVCLKFNLLEPRGAPDRLEGELCGVWLDGTAPAGHVGRAVCCAIGVRCTQTASTARSEAAHMLQVAAQCSWRRRMDFGRSTRWWCGCGRGQSSG